MNEYREPAKEPAVPPIVVRIPRTLGVGVLLAAFALGFSLVCYGVSGGGHLVCSRSRGACTLTTWRGIEAIGTTQDLKLADIVRAELVEQDSVTVQKNGTTEHVTNAVPTLVLKSSREDVDEGMVNVSAEAKQSFVADVNAFLSAPDRERLDARREQWIPLVVAPFLWLLIVGSWWLVRTRVVVDKTRRLVRVERGMFGLFATEIPLDDVVGAEDSNGSQTVIACKSGPPVPCMLKYVAPVQPSTARRAELRRQGIRVRTAAAHINEALVRARE